MVDKQELKEMAKEQQKETKVFKLSEIGAEIKEKNRESIFTNSAKKTARRGSLKSHQTLILPEIKPKTDYLKELRVKRRQEELTRGVLPSKLVNWATAGVGEMNPKDSIAMVQARAEYLEQEAHRKQLRSKLQGQKDSIDYGVREYEAADYLVSSTKARMRLLDLL